MFPPHPRTTAPVTSPPTNVAWGNANWVPDTLQHYVHFLGHQHVNLDCHSSEKVIRRIDPIPPGLPGCADIRALLKGAPKYVRPALNFLLESTPLFNDSPEHDVRVQLRKVPRETLTPLMSSVIASMVQDANARKDPTKNTALYTDVSRDDLTTAEKNNIPKAHANAFLVEKASKMNEFGETLLRIITDARDGNCWMKEPSTFPVFALDALLQTVSNVMHKVGDKPWFAVNVDLRHWFHQLPLPNRYRSLFQLHLYGGARPRTVAPIAVPMGWSLAPRIAQSATWALLLGGEAPRFLKPGWERLTNLPEWIPLSDDAGGIFIILDNVFVVSSSKNIAEYWAERINRRAAECCVRLKLAEGKRAEVETIEGDKVTTFDGIDFGHQSWSTMQKPRDIDIKGNIVGDGTRKQLMSVLGEVLWDLRARALPLRDHRTFLKLYRVAHPPDGDYDATLEPPLDEDQLATLAKYMNDARKHIKRAPLPAWNTMIAMDNMQHWASDASEQRMVAVPMNVTARLPWFALHTSHTTIHDSELEAIVMCIRHGLEWNSKTRFFIIATDSMCAKGWVERGYAERQETQDLLDELYQRLHERRIACVYVHTESNVADTPTRPLPKECVLRAEGDPAAIDALRWTKTLKVIRDAEMPVVASSAQRAAQAVRNAGARREREEDVATEHVETTSK